jgi:hypothetical protein
MRVRRHDERQKSIVGARRVANRLDGVISRHSKKWRFGVLCGASGIGGTASHLLACVNNSAVASGIPYRPAMAVGMEAAADACFRWGGASAAAAEEHSGWWLWH